MPKAATPEDNAISHCDKTLKPRELKQHQCASPNKKRRPDKQVASFNAKKQV
jgi:hypothetical protein